MHTQPSHLVAFSLRYHVHPIHAHASKTRHAALGTLRFLLNWVPRHDDVGCQGCRQPRLSDCLGEGIRMLGLCGAAVHGHGGWLPSYVVAAGISMLSCNITCFCFWATWGCGTNSCVPAKPRLRLCSEPPGGPFHKPLQEPSSKSSW